MEGAGSGPARLTAARGVVLADCRGHPQRAPYSRLHAPAETELGADYAPEALILLKEDGLIRARRGVGRFISDTLPRIGIQRIRPFKEVLAGAGQTLGGEAPPVRGAADAGGYQAEDAQG